MEQAHKSFSEHVEQREGMVRTQLISRGITNDRVLQAMRYVPRHFFVPEKYKSRAYDDSPLPIDKSQTISQPFIVAHMVELLHASDGDTVLEIGTGSGYGAAVLAECVREVHTVERHQSLANAARQRFRTLGYNNIHVHVGDGTMGCHEHAPFDGIIVTAASPEIPDSLKYQLTTSGVLVLPTGPRYAQTLIRVERTEDNAWHSESLGAVRFVPLIGDHGWDA